MQLAAVDVESRRQVTLLQGAFPRFVPPRSLVFMRDDALWVVGFDPRRLTLVGEPVRLSATPEMFAGGFAEYDVGRDGTLAYRPAGEDTELLWVDRNGRVIPAGGGAILSGPRLSPDGRRVAGVRNGAVWVYDLDRNTSIPVNSGETGVAAYVAWRADGRQVQFTLMRGRALYRATADGGAPPVRLSPPDVQEIVGSWLRDGVSRVWSRWMGSNDWDIWLQPPSGPASRIVATGMSEYFAAFSPDERWLAYVADDAVYAQAYPKGQRERVSTADGGPPRWARDSRELFYVTYRGEMVAVPVDPESPQVFGRPRVLFRGDFQQSFDVDLDGRRFLMNRRVSKRLLVMLGAPEEVKSMVTTTR
jgi:Tol biopolymer transport system component